MIFQKHKNTSEKLSFPSLIYQKIFAWEMASVGIIFSLIMNYRNLSQRNDDMHLRKILMYARKIPNLFLEYILEIKYFFMILNANNYLKGF